MGQQNNRSRYKRDCPWNSFRGTVQRSCNPILAKHLSSRKRYGNLRIPVCWRSFRTRWCICFIPHSEEVKSFFIFYKGGLRASFFCAIYSKELLQQPVTYLKFLFNFFLFKRFKSLFNINDWNEINISYCSINERKSL